MLDRITPHHSKSQHNTITALTGLTGLGSFPVAWPGGAGVGWCELTITAVTGIVHYVLSHFYLISEK